MCNISKPCIIWVLRDYFYTAVYHIFTASCNHPAPSFVQVRVRCVNIDKIKAVPWHSLWILSAFTNQVDYCELIQQAALWVLSKPFCELKHSIENKSKIQIIKEVYENVKYQEKVTHLKHNETLQNLMIDEAWRLFWTGLGTWTTLVPLSATWPSVNE